MSYKFTKEFIETGISYKEYIKLSDDLLKQNRTTGKGHPDSYVEYTKLNQARIRRLEKTIVINDELREKVKSIKEKTYLVVITEAWCGDAAQNIPVFGKLEEINENLVIKIFLRDEHEDLINEYLTNGVSKSIPIIVSVNADSMKENWVWGPRPLPAQKMHSDHKANPGTDDKEVKKNIQLWYNDDKTKFLQKEILHLLNSM
ncbi:thioredoxin family protein [soil metagenome]